MEAAVKRYRFWYKNERGNEIMTRKNFKNANEQLVLFTESEMSAVSDWGGSRREKNTARYVSSKNGGSRSSGSFRNPFDSFDANRYHTVGADVEANAEIGYGRYDNEVIMADRFHNYYSDVDYATPDECDSVGKRLPDYILWETRNSQKCESDVTETGEAHGILQKYSNARIKPKGKDETSSRE